MGVVKPLIYWLDRINMPSMPRHLPDLHAPSLLVADSLDNFMAVYRPHQLCQLYPDILVGLLTALPLPRG